MKPGERQNSAWNWLRLLDFMRGNHAHFPRGLALGCCLCVPVPSILVQLFVPGPHWHRWGVTQVFHASQKSTSVWEIKQPDRLWEEFTMTVAKAAPNCDKSISLPSHHHHHTQLCNCLQTNEDTWRSPNRVAFDCLHSSQVQRRMKLILLFPLAPGCC